MDGMAEAMAEEEEGDTPVTKEEDGICTDDEGMPAMDPDEGISCILPRPGSATAIATVIRPETRAVMRILSGQMKLTVLG